MRKRRLSVYWIGVILFGVVILTCELLTGSTGFCDYYVNHLFSVSLNTYGRLMGIFPFSVGSVLIVAAILWVILEIALSILFLFLRKKRRYRNFVRKISKCFLVFCMLAAWLLVTNCSTLYGCSRMNVKGNREKEYGLQQIRILRDYIAGQCNALAEEMERDQDGNVTLPDMTDAVKSAMVKLGKEYPRLAGYYPDPKPIPGSFLMYQAGYDGVYFPFSMEANYNTYISDIRYPHVISHELAHLKGYIYEDEADFIAYLACTGSGDQRLQYAGYLAVLDYVDGDYMQSLREESDVSEIEISEKVWRDAPSYTPQTGEMLTERERFFEDETMETVGETITDTYLGYYDASPNYAEVTRLLLAYYDGILY